MSRQLCDDNYYKVTNNGKPLPIRWMATESLENGKFTFKTDMVCCNFYMLHFTLKLLRFHFSDFKYINGFKNLKNDMHMFRKWKVYFQIGYGRLHAY